MASTSNKQEQLLEAARNLFMQHGFKRITVEEICRVASVSKMTYYKYFSDKAAIADVVVAELMEEGFAAYDEINRMDITYPEKVEKMTQWRIKFASQLDNDFIKEVLGMDALMGMMRDRFIQNITKAQADGEIDSDLSPEFIWIVTEKLNELILEDSWKSVFNNYGEFQKQMRKIYFHGILKQSTTNTLKRSDEN